MGADAKQRIRDETRRLLEAGVRGYVFPGASACIGWRREHGQAWVNTVAGRLTANGPPVTPQTPYDLASLTKPFVATAALRMVEAGVAQLDIRADRVIGDVRGAPAGRATLEQLLTHRAGLAAWGGLYLDVPHELGTSAARRWIVAEAARRVDEDGKMDTPVYSDLGYIIAGEMLSKIAGESLDRVVARHVTEPLGISDAVYYAGGLSPEERSRLKRYVAPTERCEWRGRVVRGEVHDENCLAMGGVSGHAGLFGTATGVLSLGRAMLDVLWGRSQFLSYESVQWALEPRVGGTNRFGWDGKQPEGSSAGKHMSKESFGHLGFTGTSIWCDPDRDLVIVLLSNRVHPSRANEKIKGFRPAFHDGVVAAYDG